MAKQRGRGTLLAGAVVGWVGLSPSLICVAATAGCHFGVGPVDPLQLDMGAASSGPGDSPDPPEPGSSMPDLCASHAQTDVADLATADFATAPAGDMTQPGPACSQSCAQCGQGKCCTDACQGQSSCNQVCTGCSCAFKCEDAPGGCNLICRGASTCVATTATTGTVALACTEGSTCDLQCDNQLSCGAVCNADSSCILRCGAAGNCDLQCNGTKIDCGNGIKVCNRRCPRS
jgi:hypothetical protein